MPVIEGGGPGNTPDTLLDVDGPTPPWGATLDGVGALIPDWKIPATLTPGQTGLSAAQVEGWIVELSGIASLRLTGYATISDPDRVSALTSAVRAAIHNGAASYVEAARHPDRAGKGDTSYSDVLWARFTGGLDALEALLGTWLTDPDLSGVGAVTPPGPGFEFPAAFIIDGLRF